MGRSPLTARGSSVATRSGELLSRKARLSLNGTSLFIFCRRSPRICAVRPGSEASARHRVQVWLEPGSRVVTSRPLPVNPSSMPPDQPTKRSSRGNGALTPGTATGCPVLGIVAHRADTEVVAQTEGLRWGGGRGPWVATGAPQMHLPGSEQWPEARHTGDRPVREKPWTQPADIVCRQRGWLC